MSRIARRLYSSIDTVPLAFDKYVAAEGVTSKVPPIVFLHGLYGNKHNNRSASRKLAKILGNEIYCLDLRNHGDSPHTYRHDYPAMAADVEQFCADHGLERAVMMGHSMGAKCAMAVALRRPDLASQVVSIDNVPCPNHGADTEFNKFKTYASLLLELTTRTDPRLTTLQEADAEFAKYEPDQMVRSFVLSNIKRDYHALKNENALVLKSKIPLDVIRDHMMDVRDWTFPESDKYEGPTLLIKADHSPFVTKGDMPSMKAHFPNYELVRMKSGHWVVTEKQDEFVDVVSKWILKHT